MRQLHVESCDSACVVGREVYADFVPHVEPLGMVVHALGKQGRPAHETERSHEVRKLVVAMELAIFDSPARKRGNRRDNFGFIQSDGIARRHGFNSTMNAGRRRGRHAAYGRWGALVRKSSNSFCAANSEEAGFCPVTSIPSTTTWGCPSAALV